MNKNKIITKLIVVAVIVLLMVLAIYPLVSRNGISLGGSAEPYNGYLLTSADASSTAVTLLKTGFGTLGSVVVSSTTSGLLKIYDGTASTSTASSTLIGSFGASPTSGTYTFDTSFTDGLIVEVIPGFVGNYTITWR